MLTYVNGGIFMRAVPGGGIFSYFLKYEITQPMHWSTFYSQTFPHHLNHGVRKEIQRLENIYSLKSKSTTSSFTFFKDGKNNTTVMYIVKESGTSASWMGNSNIFSHCRRKWNKNVDGMIKVPFYTVDTAKGRKTTTGFRVKSNSIFPWLLSTIMMFSLTVYREMYNV